MSLLRLFNALQSGRVRASGGGTKFLRADHKWQQLTNSEFATMPAMTIKGNDTAGATTPQDLTVAEVNAMLDRDAIAYAITLGGI